MTVIHSETRPGPGGHSRKVADGESKDTRTRCGGSKGKPRGQSNRCSFCFGALFHVPRAHPHPLWLPWFHLLSLPRHIPRSEIHRHNQSTLGKDPRNGWAGSTCDQGTWSVPLSSLLPRQAWSLSSSCCSSQVPEQIAEVTEAHVEEFDRQRKVVEEATPPYSVEELM